LRCQSRIVDAPCRREVPAPDWYYSGATLPRQSLRAQCEPTHGWGHCAAMGRGATHFRKCVAHWIARFVFA
jgi:hypothetical protein